MYYFENGCEERFPSLLDAARWLDGYPCGRSRRESQGRPRIQLILRFRLPHSTRRSIPKKDLDALRESLS